MYDAHYADPHFSPSEKKEHFQEHPSCTVKFTQKKYPARTNPVFHAQWYHRLSIRNSWRSSIRWKRSMLNRNRYCWIQWNTPKRGLEKSKSRRIGSIRRGENYKAKGMNCDSSINRSMKSMRPCMPNRSKQVFFFSRRRIVSVFQCRISARNDH